jgi:hypothetical protein
VKVWPWAWVLLVPLVPWTQQRVDARLGAWPAEGEGLYLWSGEQVRRTSLDFEALMADVYWLRTVQYFGGQRAFAGGGRFDLLKPLVEVTITLDPRMEIAYRYGATFLAEAPPMGAGRVQDAIAILERGVRDNPGSWRLRQDLALFHFFFSKDARAASGILLEASRQPGAPPYFANLAAALLTRGGEKAAARQLWEAIRDQSEPGPMKDNAALHVAILDAQAAADAVNAASDAFASRAGRRAHSLDEIRAAGLLQGSLADPTGVPFAYDPHTGRASIARGSRLWRASY